MDKKNKRGTNFISQIISADLEQNLNDGRIQTRFPPEPNGYLHIGHAKALSLSFDIASEFSGKCFLRFDDTNPEKEDKKYEKAIKEDIAWLGYSWDKLTYASDYFPKLYDFAKKLILDNKAYVDSLSIDKIKEYRGTLTDPGIDSPYRDRSIEENFKLFEDMANGVFEEGEHVLRAKIDMSSSNINLRDPILYRIRKVSHQNTNNDWCIYPMYDFAHTLSDLIEKTTHSLCSLEFEDHRPLYEWFLGQFSLENNPKQIEFSRLNLMFTVMSKRKLRDLVDSGYVSGWNDPRMPTISGMRRRGYTAQSIRDFIYRVGVTKKNNTIQLSNLENCVREDLDQKSERRFAILKPLKIVIENFPDNEDEIMLASNHPTNESLGKRKIIFSREIYIERDDFMEHPPSKFFRLSPNSEVRLKYGYIIRCEKIIKDKEGNIIELRCTYDPSTKSGSGASQKKVKGTIHWVSANQGQKAEVHLYDRLFNDPFPDKKGSDLTKHINPHSLEIIKDAIIEPSLSRATVDKSFQFERLGYFKLDQDVDSKKRLVFLRILSLRDTWSKIEKQSL
tara:strand:- start:10199 stop:11881 length:1683 start_codon:yes stop_codon:yes gene_type:complete